MKVMSLFSGIGGFDLAFQNAGTQSVTVCEKDKHAQNVLRRHFPEAKMYDDVRSIGASNHEAVDLICGGFPCQDLSIAGKRKGLAGERSGLWFEFARIIDELEPSWVVIENVPGLLSSNGGRDLAVILSWLGNRGYGWTYRVLDAQYFGVPQRRRRVFIVASFGSERAAEVLFERESSSGNFAQGGEAGQADPRTFVINLANGGANQNNVKESQVSDTLDTWGTQAVAFNGTIRMQEKAMPTVSRHWGTGGNNVPFVGVRRLTPLECERLQGFPDGWTDGQSDTQRYKQLGNAVAVPVVEWIGRRIMAVSHVPTS